MASDGIVVIQDIAVMFVAGDRAKMISEQGPSAFDELEAKLKTFKGRHFYGVIVEGEYRACAGVRPEDDPQNLPHRT